MMTECMRLKDKIILLIFDMVFRQPIALKQWEKYLCSELCSI